MGEALKDKAQVGGVILSWFCLFVAKRVAEAEPGGRVD